jgi:hypothetical protein
MLNKWLFSCPALVLAAGLIACDKKEAPSQPDGFHVKNAVWQSEGGTLSFRRRKESPKFLKFNDALMIDNNDVDLRVDSRCIVSHEDKTKTSFFPSTKKYYLFSMLPPEVLMPDAVKKENPIRCSFKFEFSNALGSLHVDSFPELLVEDDSEKNFQISWQEKEKRKFDSKQLAAVRMFSVSNEAVGPTLQCSIHKDLKHQRGDKAEFLLSDFQWRNDFKTTTTDKCRVVGRQKGNVTMLSPTFEISFVVPPPPLPKVDACPTGTIYTYGLRKGDGDIMYSGTRPVCKYTGAN